MADKQDDVDALLASLSEPASPEAKKLPVPAHDELTSYGERSQSFKIDPRDASISGTDKLRKDFKSLEVNPEDFTDHLSLREESRRRKLLFGVLGLMAFLLLLGFIGYNLIQNNTAQAVYKVPTDSSEEQRFLNLFPEAPAADTTKTITTVAFENGLSIPDGYTLTFAGMDFTALGYQASAAADFGPAAVAKVDGPWNETSVYLFKDMAHSKAFSSAWDGEPVQVEGSPAAAVMLMELSSGVHAVLAIVNPDSTGFMVVLPQNLNYESAVNLKDFVRIEKSVVNGNPTDTTSVTAANFLRFCSPRTNQQWTSPTYDAFGIDSKLRIDSVEVPFSDETKKDFAEADVLRLWGVKDENGNNLLYVQSNTSIFPLDAPTAEYRGEADRLKGQDAEAYVAKVTATKEYDRLEECMAILAPSQKG